MAKTKKVEVVETSLSRWTGRLVFVALVLSALVVAAVSTNSPVAFVYGGL